METFKKTNYFKQVVLAKRPYIKEKWCIEAIVRPDYVERQEDGRYKYWLYIEDLGKHLRVITLEDGTTLHNAFPDRNFRRKE